MKVLFIEPFYGGSHRLFADQVKAFSRHDIRLLTLPASFWKWRMRGAHLSLASRVEELRGSFERLLVTDMLSLAELFGTVPGLAEVPAVVYFHENQLSYPVPRGESPDIHFGFTNISTALAASGLVFNSGFHRDEFLEGIEPFLGAMPDRRPRKLGERMRPKASVVYPGVDCRELDLFRPGRRSDGPLTILWNHRWEFDKSPEVFFRVLGRLAAEGLDFRVHVLGENFQVKPKPFLEAREVLGERIATFGYLAEREEYIRTLWDSDVVVSTAVQEFYGIAMMEAAYCGCRPLLPRRLVYPELFEEEFLYDGEEELENRLRLLAGEGPPGTGWESRLRAGIREKHDVRRSVHRLDALVEGRAAGD